MLSLVNPWACSSWALPCKGRPDGNYKVRSLLYHPTNVIIDWDVKILAETSRQILVVLAELRQVVVPFQLADDVAGFERLGVNWHSELVLEVSHEVAQLFGLLSSDSVIALIA